MMRVLCGQSRTLRILDGTQASLSAPDRTQPSSSMIQGASTFRLAHTRTDLSKDPETIWLPLGENATDKTALVCSFSSLSCSPVLASHTHTDSSREPETIRLPSGENATELTLPVCPCSSPSCTHDFASHTRICLQNQRQFGCHQVRMQPPRHGWCALPAPLVARSYLHPTPELIRLRNQRRFGCHQARKRPTRHLQYQPRGVCKPHSEGMIYIC